ncbi:hypothetical protein [Peribacillus alkalitolerans]|uniref:hypothetical protein n=1 Tax=Peribacillus alkalitolerans TaxID=1550385 RepID=UPI001F075EEE|nr:hypothetical protein [Peribacillus alkalitolerans]
MVFKKIALVFLICLTMVGCNSNGAASQLKNVGLLVPETVNDQVWGTKGYIGLLSIQSELGKMGRYSKTLKQW